MTKNAAFQFLIDFSQLRSPNGTKRQMDKGSSPVKPKFHYADFATFTETSPQGKSRAQIIKVRDTNHIADFHDLCR